MITITKGTSFYHLEYYYNSDGDLANVASTSGTKLVDSAGDVLTPTVSNISTGKYSISFATTSLVIGTPYTLILVGDADIKSYPVSVVAPNATPAQVADIPSVAGLATSTNVTESKDAILAKLPSALDGSGNIKAGVQTIITDAITADSVKADAVTKIQNTLAKSSEIPSVAGLASQSSVNAIPTNPLLTDDTRLDNIGLIKTAVDLIKTAVDAIADGTTKVRANNSANQTIPTTISNLQSVITSLNSMIVANKYTEAALENAPTGGGGSSSVVESFSQSALDQLNGVTITISPPKKPNSDNLVIYQGASYLDIDDRAIPFTSTTEDQYNLDNKSVWIRMVRSTKSNTINKESQVFIKELEITSDTGIQIFSLELTSAETLALKEGIWNYSINIVEGNNEFPITNMEDLPEINIIKQILNTTSTTTTTTV